MYVVILTKITCSDKGNLDTERIGNLDTQFFVFLAETFGVCFRHNG